MEIPVKMRALLVYDSTFGNTEQIARTIAEGLGGRYTVHLVPAAESAPLTSYTSDLLVVGGPTQRRHMSPPLRALLKVLPRRGLQGSSRRNLRHALSHDVSPVGVSGAGRSPRARTCRVPSRCPASKLLHAARRAAAR